MAAISGSLIASSFHGGDGRLQFRNLMPSAALACFLASEIPVQRRHCAIGNLQQLVALAL
jgi:hypothetical protein